jgi:hypothetical protein
MNIGACVIVVIGALCAIGAIGIILVIGGANYNEHEDYLDREQEAKYWRERGKK